MTDLFPAVASVYPPEAVSVFEYPYSLIGFSDRSAQNFTECRVIVHNNQVIVGATTARGPSVVFSDTVRELLVEPPYTRVLTDSGSLVVFGVSKGCGCGSRLRSWNPYGSIIRK